MKKIIQIFFIGGLLAVSFLLVQKIQKENRIPCGKPMTYSIGTIDPRFNISKEVFAEEISQAEKFWEDAMGKNLFEPVSADPKITLNMIFDERQQQTLESKQAEGELTDLKEYLNKFDKDYENQILIYQQRLKKYQNDLDAYNADVKKFSKKVDIWNNQGGNDKDEYDDLKKEQKKWTQNINP